MKKRLIILLVICLLITQFSFVSASEKTTSKGYGYGVRAIDVKDALGEDLHQKYIKALKKINNASRENLVKEYDLKTITLDELPEGSSYIKLENEAQLKAFLEVIHEMPRKVTKEFKINKSELQEDKTDNNTIVTPHSTSTMIQTVSTTGWYNAFGKVALYARIELSRHGSFGWISGCHEYTRHTGFTFGFAWEEDYCYSDFTGDQTTSVNVYGGGTVKYVVFVEGLGTVYSKPVDMTINYSLQ